MKPFPATAAMLPALAISALTVLAMAPPALAHVTLDRSELPADSYVRVAVRVPHGCEGAAMTGLRVRIPAELRAVKPAPKPGWTLTTVPADAPPSTTPAEAHDAGPAIKEVSWQGGNLPDAFYDEFILYIRTPAEPGPTLYFATVQECEGGKVTRWIERPEAGNERPPRPAYPVRIVPKP